MADLEEIREKMQKIRTDIALLIEKCGVGATDEILDITVSRGGGKCQNPYCDEGCPFCKGTGTLPKEEKTIGQIIEEWMK